MLISGSIPNMFNGVSQQAAPLRHPSQCEAQINAYSSIAKGLSKRPPSKHIAKLTASSHLDAFIHTINRDTSERYKVVIDAGDLWVYDIDGTAKTVSFPDGKTYLASSDPQNDFVAVTVADYTFIVNRTIVAAMDAATVAGTVAATKQEFTNLAAPTGSNAINKITGSPSSSFDNYYVKDTGTWVEHGEPGSTYILDDATMPHKLVRNIDGTFTFAVIDWDDRLVGDDSSNPQPSFIGRTIRDIFFFRNRLGFIADEAFVLSRPGSYFNYWITTVTASLDSDPVDSEVSNTKVSILNFAVPFNKALLLFSDQSQFQVTGGDVFTQRTARADVVTEFTSSRTCRPLGLNTSLFFAAERGDYTGVREYYVEEDTVSNDAADITAHVPSYLPSGVSKIAGCGSEDLLLFSSRSNVLYPYKFYWGDKEKLQSSWSKFTFDSGDTILDVDFIGTVAYLVVERSDGVYLESMDFQPEAIDTGFLYTILLDRRVALTGVYDAPNNRTTWTMPYADSGDIRVVLGTGFGSSAGTQLATTQPSTTTVRATGDYSAAPAFVGRAYEMRYTLSELHMRDDKQGAVKTGRLQILRMYLAYKSSGYFRVEVTPKARETYVYPFTGKVLGDSSLVLGVDALHSGVFKYPVMSRNTDTVIDLVNDSHLPSTFQSSEWEGDFVVHSQRT